MFSDWWEEQIRLAVEKAGKDTVEKFAKNVIKKYGCDKLTHEDDEDIDIYLTASELYEIAKEITEGMYNET